MRKTTRFSILIAFLMLILLLAACSAPTVATEEAPADATEAPDAEVTEAADDEEAEPTEEEGTETEAGDGEPVTIRWFVGLGAGTRPEQLDAQQAFVDAYNSTHEDIQIEL